jgi:hypothetical protein
MSGKKPKKKPVGKSKPKERKFPPAKKGTDWIRPDKGVHLAHLVESEAWASCAISASVKKLSGGLPPTTRLTPVLCGCPIFRALCERWDSTTPNPLGF